MLLFLLADLASDGERINVDRDGVVQEPEIGQTLDDSRIRRARPAGEDNYGMVMAVEVKAEVRLSAAFGMPAIFMDGQFLGEAVGRVVVEAFCQRRVEKPFVMPEMVEVRHRQNSRAGRAKDFQQQPEDVLVFGHELIEQRGVVIAAGRGGLEGRRHVLQCA